MSTVTITLSDVESGMFEMSCNFGAEFDKNSHAHQHANLILKTLDELAKQASAPIAVLSDEIAA